MRTYVDALVKDMGEVLNENELRTLTLKLNLDWEELPGLVKSDKAYYLIVRLAKEGRLSDLITILHAERSHIQWMDAPPSGEQMVFGAGINLEWRTAFTAFSLAVNDMGRFGDQVVDYATGSHTVGTTHQRIVEARQGVIVNRSYGLMETITPEQFEEKLEAEDREHINTLAEAMENHYQQWRKLYPKRGSYTRPAQNKKVEQQLDELVQEVAQELGRIIRYLDKLNFTLDDHYQRYRDLAERYS
ncbi:MAG TPA: hypothetical protein PLK31_04115 [Chloroflexota bacterium]|nr:hypothetical protein [Chloroflexota bacterium]